VDADMAKVKYFRLVHTTARGIPVTISRTGYTGDLGYVIWVDAGRAVALWDALIETGTPYGIARRACGRSTSRASRPA
jgi:aminomethyltransferase